MKQVLTLALAVLGVVNAILMPFGPIWHLVCLVIGVQATIGFVTDKYPNLAWVKDITRALYWSSEYYGKKITNFIKYKL
jgi:hypothetical protein